MFDHLGAAEQEPAALGARGTALDLHDGKWRVGEAAEEVREHSGREVAARLVESRLRCGLAPVIRVERRHGVVQVAHDE